MAQCEDLTDSKKESVDKKSVKTILSQFLQPAHGIALIQVLLIYRKLGE